MIKVNAEDIEYAAYESDDFDQDNIRYDYSGRAMYGQTCLAIVGSLRDLGAFMCTVVPHVNEDLVPMEAWPDVHMDSMGLQQVFYWPHIHVVKPKEK